MKGMLYKTEIGWVVKYFSPPTVNHFGWVNSDSKFCEIPLHSDCLSNNLEEVSKIEFEIIKEGKKKFAKII